MLPFRVRHFKGRSTGRRGEEIVILTDARGSPASHYHPNLFSITEYRNVGRSPNTIDKVLRAIGMAKVWAETRGRNLDEELSEGSFVNAADVLDLTRFLGLNAIAQLSEFEASKSGSKIVPFDRNRRQRDNNDDSEDSGEVVPSNEVGNRIRWVAKYLEWHRHRRFDNRNITEADARLSEVAVKAVADLQAKAPSNTTRWGDDETLEAPDPEILQRIESILMPGSPENPFQSPFIQWRNYLAWRLLSDSGARRNEVKSAAVDSVSASNNRFEIRESKTVPRTVPIIDLTANAFDYFFFEHWLKLPEKSEGRRKGILFTDANGEPLTSGKFINRMFLAVREIIGPLPWKLTPHTMRRAWNHLLSLKLDRLPEGKRFSPQQEAETRIRIMGWSENSRQAARYNRRHIRETADKIAQEMMDQLYTLPDQEEAPL